MRFVLVVTFFALVMIGAAVYAALDESRPAITCGGMPCV